VNETDEAQIVIRAGMPGDLAAITQIYNHYIAHTPATFDLEPFTTEQRRPWFSQFGTERHRLFVATADDDLLGFAYSARFRPKAAYDNTVETTIYLRPDATGRGVGSRLYEHLFSTLDRMLVHRAIAVITLPNDASVALHERFGFLTVGDLDEVGFKFDRHWTTRWMQRRRPTP